MASPALTVQIASWNAGNASPGAGKLDLTSWLWPTLSEGSEKRATDEPPDIYAVGFPVRQFGPDMGVYTTLMARFVVHREVLALNWAFLGLSQTVLDAHDNIIANCIDHATGRAEKYTLVSKTIHGGMALLVYTRDATVTKRVADVRVAAAGCGPLFMANKGAVGVRLSLSREDGDDEAFTFVTSHLAAHSHKVARRNADWKDIVARLIFTPDSMSSSARFAPGRPRSPFKRQRGSRSDQLQIWDTSYLFLCALLHCHCTPFAGLAEGFHFAALVTCS